MAITLESPIKLRKRLRSLTKAFVPVRAKLKEVQNLALRNHTELSLITAGGHTHLYRLVNFYQLVSPWCDMGEELRQLERDLSHIDYGQYNKVRQALVALAAQEERDPYGVNRTSQGQVPSSETTFLGNRLGIWTHYVSHWEEHRATLASQPAIIGQPDSPTVMEVIDEQASTLVKQGLRRWKTLLQDLIGP